MSDTRKTLHALVERLFDTRLSVPDRIEAGANIRATVAHRIERLDRRFLEEVREDLAEKLRKLPSGGGIA